ncbi:LysR family transcriptional regulator [Pandoraea nosoerga]|uniref:LysR family transcriptional regulator n=1 Tax=Pandoraea nosoerga TaxID=2508296 RepID=A0A5E4REL8_9BURK|nr:LysR family transcriptional regulator [Pandoraea nosoerga]MBN4664402.1 LysR family transcriptional regulator [Pandoraea nosoerga]MBN4674562.1 LysR family transcriptional regulator [Pandoraea nosoerga]MBN4679830.1 LysR family transcriptional regulator [Pandoraea nosoerga]MBN4743083.1 LysR family transcriptional regulator [Pandoraea nosoerga]VVD61637.1 LysR family transcriptional regulator [Pandoraea nosoerga]
MVNPQWLKSFSTLAELGNFTRTADRLGLTQAAVSQHVKHLEAEFGPLLVRRPRAIELTPAGQALLSYSVEVECAARHLHSRLADANEECGEITLITPGSIGLYLCPILLDMQKANPAMAVRHRFAPDREVLEGVLQNHFELGLVTLRPEDPRLAATPFTQEPLELVVPAGEDVHRWEDLRRIGYIDHPDGEAMATRLLSRRFPGNPGVRSLPCKGCTNQISLILEYVARGLGFTIIPQYARQAFATQEAIRVVDCGPPVVDTLWLIHRAEWPLSARAQRAVALLRERVDAPRPRAFGGGRVLQRANA